MRLAKVQSPDRSLLALEAFVVHSGTVETNSQKILAPEPIMRAALRVLFVASYTTRNWSLGPEVSVAKINDLWEALHEVPALLCSWRDGAEFELRSYFREYDEKWGDLSLMFVYEDALQSHE